jgi:hypothetical protein
MPLAPINIPPGVVKTATPLQVKGRYWDANLIRWRAGKLLPVGGWQRITSSPLASTPRTLFPWVDEFDQLTTAIGCNENIYVLVGSTYTDVTPANFVTEEAGETGGYGAGDYGELLYGLDYAGVGISTVVRSSNVVTVTTSAANKFITGMSVMIAGVTNSSFNGTFTVTVTNSTTFTYSQTAANASSTGGTASLPTADWRPTSAAFIPSFSWTIDNWGTDILAVASSDGRLLHFNGNETMANPVGYETISTAVRTSNVVTITTQNQHGYTTGDTIVISGTSVGSMNGTFTVVDVPDGYSFTYSNSGTNASGTGGTANITPAVPTNNRGVIVTPERHAVLIGAEGNTRRVAWSSREDYTDWNFADTTTTAGYLDLDTSSKIIMCAAVREGTLIWTEDEAWLMQYIGLPYIYSITRIGYGCGLIAPRAFATTAGRCIWMSKESFWIYDGGTVRPLRCDVGSYVFDNIDPNEGLRITHGAENGLYPEVWFWYPSDGSDVPDKYVVYNYAEDWWTIGSMTRTASVGAGVLDNPMASDASNDLYFQEVGWTDAGASLVGDRWVETSSINIQNGNLISHIRQAITDSGYGYDSTQITVYSSFTPEGTETVSGPYNPRPSGYTDMRVSGRDFRMKITATEDAPWSIGEMRVEFMGGGGR